MKEMKEMKEMKTDYKKHWRIIIVIMFFLFEIYLLSISCAQKEILTCTDLNMNNSGFNFLYGNAFEAGTDNCILMIDLPESKKVNTLVLVIQGISKERIDATIVNAEAKEIGIFPLHYGTNRFSFTPDEKKIGIQFKDLKGDLISLQDIRLEYRDNFQYIAFLLLSLLAFMMTYFCFFYNNNEILQNKIIKAIYFLSAVVIIWIIKFDAFRKINDAYYDYPELHKYIILSKKKLLIVLIIFASIFIYCWKKKKVIKKANMSILLMIIANSCVVFLLLEGIYNMTLFKMSKYYVCLNIVIISILTLVLVFIFNSSKIAIVFIDLFYYIWGLANYFVSDFKGQPITPPELLGWKTALNVAGSYQYRVPKIAIIVTGILLISLFVQVCIKSEYKIAFSVKKRILTGFLGVIGIVILYVGLIKTEFTTVVGVENNNWWPATTYSTYGTQLSFLSFYKAMQIKKPENYTLSKIDKTIEQYADSNEQEEVNEKPVVIAIMNEAFADLEWIKKLNLSDDPLKYYHSLEDNVIKGNMLVSTFGGGTSMTEYEFLTGNSMELFDATTVPYVQFINHDSSSLASILKQQGYKTFAIHPGKATNWNRKKVYPLLGFDEFISLEKFSEPDKLRGYVTDQCDYQYIKRILEENKNNPVFIFNVTIQNHSGYEIFDFNNTVEIKDENFQDVNQYLTLIQKSDKALQELIEYLKTYDRPVILAFFGDHFPALSDTFYNWIYDKNSEDRTLEETLKMYETPFLIWTNYNITEEKGVLTSANYLSSILLKNSGLKMPIYNQFLLNMFKEIPQIALGGYRDKMGVYHNYNEQTVETNLINQYNCLQYNNLFDKHNKRMSLFNVIQ